MKIAIKGKGELKYVDAENLLIRNKPITHILQEMERLHDAYEKLVYTIRNSTIVRKGDIVVLNDQIQEVQNITVFEKPEKDIKLYKVQDGKLVLDNKKVGAI